MGNWSLCRMYLSRGHGTTFSRMSIKMLESISDRLTDNMATTAASPINGWEMSFLSHPKREVQSPPKIVSKSGFLVGISLVVQIMYWWSVWSGKSLCWHSIWSTLSQSVAWLRDRWYNTSVGKVTGHYQEEGIGVKGFTSDRGVEGDSWGMLLKTWGNPETQDRLW